MLESERHRLIRATVEHRSVVGVGDLVTLLGASEATVRRDIGALAERGEVRRVRGGVEALRPRHQPHLVGTPFSMAREEAAAEKRAIARLACSLIEAGQSVAIHGGTTTFAMGEFLLDAELDIFTNSFPLAAELFQKSRNRLHLPAGALFREQNIILSPMPEDGSAHFRADILFTGCFGLSRQGLMEADPLIVQAQTRLFERAERVVLLADGRKFNQKSSTIVAPLSRVAVLVTDAGAPPEAVEEFRQAGVEVLIAEVAP